ncbi:MAG: hypothetical protein RL186_1555 [Pseudomonadota bacterium]|jgi:hypothetical protein
MYRFFRRGFLTYGMVGMIQAWFNYPREEHGITQPLYGEAPIPVANTVPVLVSDTTQVSASSVGQETAEVVPLRSSPTSSSTTAQ